MTIIFVTLAFVIGALTGYLAFYFRYKEVHLVDELRRNLKDYDQQINAMKGDYDEFMQQNLVLKDKVSELLDKNNDLAKIVSELSRYYYHIKQGVEKTKELLSIFGNVDHEFEEKISAYQTKKDSIVTTPHTSKHTPSHNKKHHGFF